MDTAKPDPDCDESTRTTTRTRSRNTRIEMITRAEPRRSWTLDQKREIVAESLGPGVTPSGVARKYAISSGQLYTWRQQLLGVQTALVQRGMPKFAEVEVHAEPPPAEPKAAEPAQPPSSTLSRPEGLIELVLPNGMVLRLDAHVDGQALRRILGVVERS